MEEQFPEEINAPGVDSIINFVFVNADASKIANSAEVSI
jgi:hypothetical protein